MAEKELKPRQTRLEQKNYYPHFSVKNNKAPNLLFAFPFIGLLIKIILLIPVFIESIFLAIAFVFILFINWFVVLFTGAYWDAAYTFFLGLMRFGAKIVLYIYGITDKYPGFGLDTNGICELDIEKPKNPSRWLAIPFIGIFIRIILLIPYDIFSSVMSHGAGAAMIGSWFAVLFNRTYPEGLYEFERDSVRVSSAQLSYLVGLKDNYPSFTISMEHQKTKLVLLIIGTLLTVLNWKNSENNRINHMNYYQQYNNQQQSPQWYTPR